MEFKKVIERINELYKKSKAEGLTEEEKKEQKELREYYLEVFRNNMKTQMNGVQKVSSKKKKKYPN